MKPSCALVIPAALCCGIIAKSAQAAPKKSHSAASLHRVDSQNNAGMRARIDIVFCIDCSGSMGGVIETAKQKIWGIVNQIARAKPSPILRIGLIGYGDGARQFRKFPLSDDLDEVYQHLMTFRDQGWSDEYVGLLVHKATTEMSWAQQGSHQLNVIYVVGNETARQGPPQFDYAKTTPRAMNHEIWVNAIYCGSSGGEETWREMARLGHGEYLHIAGDGGGITIPTPYDKTLDALNVALNKTYLPFGRQGLMRSRNQARQDSNAKAVGGLANSASRAMAKSSMQYNNRGWDLVDAQREKDFKLSEVKKEALPPAMQKMNPTQQRAFIAQNARQRSAVQVKIRKLSEQREAYIRVQIKKRGLNQTNALDDAIRRSVVGQATKRGYKF